MRTYFQNRAEETRENLAIAPELGLLLEESISRYETQQVQLDGMYRHFDLVGLGASFSNSLNQYAVVLRDASTPGAYRATFFDSKGFFGHSTRKTVDEILLELCQSGYHRVMPCNTLERLAETPEFILGNHAVALRHAMAAGKLTHDEADKQYGELRESFAVA